MGSVFDVMGPVMIGPSSSHTAGAARLAKMARHIFREAPVNVVMTLFGSFAKTYKGHGTNKALIAGLLDFEADDPRIREAMDWAVKEGLRYQFIESPADAGHPNVVTFDLYGNSGRHMTITGRSLGGGRICITQIDGLEVEITGDEHTLLTFHHDQPGVIGSVCMMLGNAAINISTMRVFREAKHSQAMMLIHTDTNVDAEMLARIETVPGVHAILYVEPL